MATRYVTHLHFFSFPVVSSLWCAGVIIFSVCINCDFYPVKVHKSGEYVVCTFLAIGSKILDAIWAQRKFVNWPVQCTVVSRQVSENDGIIGDLTLSISGYSPGVLNFLALGSGTKNEQS